MDDATLEHRLTQIEEAIKSGAALQAAETRTLAVEVAGMKHQVKEQNGRIGKLEQWRQDADRVAAFVKGVAEGKAEISKGQIAFLTVAGPLLFGAISVALTYWS